MQQSFKYFEQEGSVFFLKGQKVYYYSLSLLAFAAAIALFLSGLNQGARFVAALFAFVGCIGILRSTGKASFDIASRQIFVKATAFSTEKVYSFTSFDHFLISKMSAVFIPLNVSAIMILEESGREKRIMLRQGFFFTRPMQRLTEELGEIMGLPRDTQ